MVKWALTIQRVRFSCALNMHSISYEYGLLAYFRVFNISIFQLNFSVIHVHVDVAIYHFRTMRIIRTFVADIVHVHRSVADVSIVIVPFNDSMVTNCLTSHMPDRLQAESM